MPNGNNNQVNPYEYLNEFSNPYSTSQAFTDIGYDINQQFLERVDPETGLKYRDLIPEYDPYEEERMRTEFSQGAQSAYQATVGELAGITSQARQQRAASGFAGGGAMQRMEQEGREGLQRQYGSAFQGALLDLVSGIRGQRTQYQEDLAGLLQSFGTSAFNYQGSQWSDYAAAPSDPPAGYSGDNQMQGHSQKGSDGHTYVWNGARWVRYNDYYGEPDEGGGTGELGDPAGSGGDDTEDLTQP